MFFTSRLQKKKKKKKKKYAKTKLMNLIKSIILKKLCKGNTAGTIYTSQEDIGDHSTN